MGSINRNIVECKVASAAELARIGVCINRNIVECKEFTSPEKTDRRTEVLIETLWNVKSSAKVTLTNWSTY